MNVKANFLEWFIKRGTYPTLGESTVLKYIDGYIDFLGFDPFDVIDDFSNIEVIKQEIISRTSALKSNQEYIDFQYRSSRNAPEAFLGKRNYFVFLDELKSGKSNLTTNFKQTIESLKIELERDDKTKKLFNFGKTMSKYVWIKDNKNLIGDEIAHYEISLDRIHGKYTIDVHFEGDSLEKKQFQPVIDNLPIELKAITWQNAKSIRHKKSISANHPALIAELKNQLYFIENSIGDKIREIIKKSIINSDKHKMASETSLNQILFGPPGTGKTYNAINKAVAIANPGFETLTKIVKK